MYFKFVNYISEQIPLNKNYFIQYFASDKQNTIDSR